MSFNAIINTPSPVIIMGDGWYPDLAVADFQAMYRLPQEYAASLVADHLELAVSWAMRQLAEWRQQKVKEGCADISSAGRYAELLYRRAVFSHAKGLLLGQFAAIPMTASASREKGSPARDNAELADKFFAWAQNAVSDLLSRPRVDVELL